jgi:hypothetical protein
LNQILPAGLGIAKAISSRKNSENFAGEETDDGTASEDEDDTANEGAAFENIMPAKTSFKHLNLLSSEDLALIESNNPSKKTKSIEMENGKKIIIMNFSF